jgi:hypothetical protein
MSIQLTPNMNLPVPSVGIEAGPAYATDVNNCLELLDSHNHAPGSGVQIDPTGLNINADLPLNENNLTEARSLRLSPQSAAIAGADDLACLYAVDDDLYFNDGLGNQIQITANGAVAGTPGSIANLVAPASASYVSASAKFVWQSDTNIAADLDAGSLILRRGIASSAGLTVAPPSSLTVDYTITLPALPVSQKIMTLDASGNLSAPYTIDGTSLEIAANVIGIKDLGVSTAKLAALSVTTPKLADQNVTQGKLQLRTLHSTTVPAGGIGISASSGVQPLGTGVEVTITDNIVTITTTGRPVFIGMIGYSGVQSFMSIDGSGTLDVYFNRDGARLSNVTMNALAGATQIIPPGAFFHVDTPPAGTYVYNMSAKNTTANGAANNVKMVVYEL